MKNLLSLIILLFSTAFCFAATQRYRLMFNDDPATTVTVGWQQVSGTGAQVYYDVVDHGADWTQYPNSVGVYKTTNYMGMVNNFAKITGLTPNTAYYFVIKDSEGTSFTNSYWFKTCPNVNTETLSFVSGGDSRSGQTQRQNSNRMVAKIRPHAVLFGGDLVNTPGNGEVQQWMDDWQLAITTDRQMFPLVHSFGNHEAGGTGGPEMIEQLFDTPYDVYYNVKFGGDLFSMYTLNGELLPGHTIPNATKRTAQKNWLHNELVNDNSIWKAAQYHRPIVPHWTGKGEGADEFDDWANDFYDYGVRVVMESDAHVTKITEQVKPTMTTASGASSGWFTTTGLAPDKGITFTGEGAWGTIRTPDDAQPFTVDMASMYQFQWIIVDKCKIEIRTIDTQSPGTVPEHAPTDLFSISAGLDAQIWKPSGLPTGLVTIIKCSPPDAEFTADFTTIFTGGTVNFTDLSTNTPNAWSWNFGDAGTSILQHPSHVYVSPGTYTVTLTATNIEGSDIETKVNYITVVDPAPVISDFVADDVTPNIAQTVNFTDLSANNPDTWLWNFGDAGTSTQQHPTHAYASPGTYTVTLTASNIFGGNAETKTNYITVSNGGTVSVQPQSGNDDAEEYTTGAVGNMYLTSSDLELGNDGGTEQIVGVRFPNITVPQGATISNAYIKFQCDEADAFSSQMNIYFKAEDIDNAPQFTSTNSNITSRTLTTAMAIWPDGAVPGWNVGSFYDSPDLTTVIQEIVDRPGWAAGNAMAIMMWADPGETSERVSGSYEGSYAAPELIFEWSVAPGLPPTAGFSQNTTTICAGQSVNFTDMSTENPTSWSWNFGDAGTSTAQNPSHTYAAPGTYTVTLTAVNGNGSDNIVMTNLITVNALPSVAAGTDQSLCTGNSLTISASGASTYSWNQGLGLGASHLVSPTSTTTYTVTGTDANGCQNTDQVIITVNPLPTVSAGSDQAVCSGNNVTITGSGATTYSWDNGLGSGASHNVSPTSTTTYTVTGTDANGCVNTDAITVTVNLLPAVSAGSDQTICAGNSVTITGSGASTYNWNNGLGTGASHSVTPGTTTTYTVTGTDGNGCVNTDAVIVNVNPLPAVSAGPDQAICNGSSINITATGAATYTWDNGLGTGASHNVSPASATTYNVTGTDVNGCFNTDAINVTVDVPGNPGTASPILACNLDNNINLNGAIVGEDAGGTWMDDDATGALSGNILDATGLTVGNTYNFTYEVAANGACPAQTVTTQITVSGTVDAGTPTTNNNVCNTNASFDLFNTVSGFTSGGSWNDDDATGVLSGSNIDGTGLAAGTYNFTYQVNGGGCGTDQETIQITITAPPTVAASGSSTICEGASANISATGATSYTWDNGLGAGPSHSVSPTVTTTYTVTGMEGACTAQASVTITVNALPVITLQGLSAVQDTICRSSEPVLLPAADPTDGTWSGTGVSGNEFNGNTAGIGSHIATYSYTDGNGCTNTESLTITVLECLGITDGENNVFNIYPNPARDYITIERDNPSEYKKIVIYDMNGKIVFDQTVTDNPIEITTDNWERGTYTITFSNDNNRKVSRKIVLQ